MSKYHLKSRAGVHDYIPDLFTFAPSAGVSLSSPIVSNLVTPVGFDSATTVTFSAGTQGSRDGGVTWSNSLTGFAPGETLKLKLLNSASSYATKLTANVLFNGSQVASWDITTQNDPAGVPVLSPSVHYNGTGLSGFNGSVPVDPARTAQGGKPAMGWFYAYRGETLADTDLMCMVEAECVGGVAYIDVYFENDVPTRLYRSKQSVYNPQAGQMESRVGYWFKLSAANTSKGNGHVARLFATAVPNDTVNMQPRTIGWNHGGNLQENIVPADTGVPGYRAPVDTGEHNAQMPFWVLPRTAKYTRTAHVKADGTGDFLTLRAALDAEMAEKATIGDEVRWDIVLHDAINDGGVPADNSTLHSTGAPGFPATRIRAASGVTATIRKGATFDPFNTPAHFDTGSGVGTGSCDAWDWLVMINNLEFYGGATGVAPDGTAHGALVVDHANFNFVLVCPESTVAVRGARFTNSAMVNAGDMFHLYWNGAPGNGGVNHPNGAGIIDSNGQGYCLSLMDCVQEYIAFGAFSLQDYRTMRVNGLGNPHDGCHAICETYTCGFDGTVFISNKEQIRISYTGPGTTATVHISRVGGFNPDGFFELKVDGTTVGSVTFPNPGRYRTPNTGTAATGTEAHTEAQLAAWINAQPGFSATVPAGALGIGWALYFLQGGDIDRGGAYTSGDIKALTSGSPGYLSLGSSADSHNEGLHLAAYGGGFENALILRQIEIQSHWSTGHMDYEFGGAGNTVRDVIQAYSLIFSTNHSWGYINGVNNDGNTNGIYMLGDHVAFINCTIDDGFVLFDRTEDLPYVSHRTGLVRTIAGGYSPISGTWNPSGTLIIDHSANAPSGTIAPYSTGEWLYTTFRGLFVAGNGDDYSPAPAGQLASHKVSYPANLSAYDAFGNAYDPSSDYIGAVSSAQVGFTPRWPTFSEATFPTL